jgi:hypothetical protein
MRTRNKAEPGGWVPIYEEGAAAKRCRMEKLGLRVLITIMTGRKKMSERVGGIYLEETRK